jgi:hypothetical protein
VTLPQEYLEELRPEVKTMNTEQIEQLSLRRSRKELLSFVRELIGTSRGREDDDNLLPPGPWDPIIRLALERTGVFGNPVRWRSGGSIFGPRPEPWKVLLTSILAHHPEIYDAIGGGHRFGESVALNPQPLPPRYVFLSAVAEAVASRAELLQEIADATGRDGTQQGIIIVGGYTSRFSDEWCGNGFRLKWPFPGPPPSWFAHELHAMDLVVIGAQLDQASQETFSPELRQHLSNASAKFVDAGLSKTC